MKPGVGLQFVRIFAILMMALAMIGVTASSVAAAPGGITSGSEARAQVVENLTLLICDTLDLNGDNTVDATEAGSLATDIDGDGDIDVTDQNIVIANCTALLAPTVPPTGDLTAVICGALDLNDDGTVDAGEAAALAIDVDRDGDIDVTDQNLAVVNCTALLAPIVPPTGPVSAIICNLLDTNDDGTVSTLEAQSLATDVDGDGDIDVADQNAVLLLCPALLAPAPGPTVPVPGGPGGPGAPIAGEPGSLVVSKFECTQIETPTATISDPVGVNTAGGDGVPEEGCVEATTFFQIFLNNDFSSEPFAEFDAGTATINGIPTNAGGVPHLLFEPEFNVFFEFFVTSGGVTTATVLNPADDGDGATPVPGGDKDGDGGGTDDGGDKDGDGGGGGAVDDKDAGGADDDGGAAADGDDGADGADGAAGAAGADGTNGAAGAAGASGAAGAVGGAGVSALPSTGQGVDAGTSGSAIVLLFGAMSLVALAAGFAWRQRHTA